MKKLFITLVLVAVVCSLFCLCAYATDIESETIPETTTEPSNVEENTQALVDVAIDVITNSTFISTLITVLTGVGGIVIFFIRGFNSIKSVINKKVDVKTLNETANKIVVDMAETFEKTSKDLNKSIEILQGELATEKENAKQLSVLLSTFILHSKIGTSAKAEMLKYINGLKEYNGTAVEIIEGIEEAIAQAEKEEEKIETPALDRVINAAISLE